MQEILSQDHPHIHIRIHFSIFPAYPDSRPASLPSRQLTVDLSSPHHPSSPKTHSTTPESSLNPISSHLRSALATSHTGSKKTPHITPHLLIARRHAPRAAQRVVKAASIASRKSIHNATVRTCSMHASDTAHAQTATSCIQADACIDRYARDERVRHSRLGKTKAGADDI